MKKLVGMSLALAMIGTSAVAGNKTQVAGDAVIQEEVKADLFDKGLSGKTILPVVVVACLLLCGGSSSTNGTN